MRVKNYFQRVLSIFLASLLCLTSLAPGFASPIVHFCPKNEPFYHNPESGRFWTEDSYEGNGSDPTSLHKYNYCNGNPANRFDPSGHFSLAEVSSAAGTWGLARIAFIGMIGTIGGAASALDTAIGSNYSASPEELGTAYVRGYLGGLVFGTGAFVAPTLTLAVGFGLGLSGLDSAITDAANSSGDDSYGKWGQVLFRAGTLGLGTAAAFRTPTYSELVGADEAFLNLGSMLSMKGRLQGRILTVAELERMQTNIRQKWGVDLKLNQDQFLDEYARVKNTTPAAAGYSDGAKVIYLRQNATLYEAMHEIRHMVDFNGPNPPKTTAESELRVYDWIKDQSWLTEQEAYHAWDYAIKF